MNNLGYCEKHQRAYEIKRIPGSWVYECPQCRKEGAYDTYATTMTELKPIEEWTASNHTSVIKEWNDALTQLEGV